MRDVVSLSPMTAEGLSRIGIGDFHGAELPDRMAWAVLIFRRVEDRDEWFPRGKSATIQEIERQLAECADLTVAQIKAEQE